MHEENFENYQDLIPEKHVPMMGLRIVAYYDEYGEMAYRVSTAENGSVPITSLIGLLELVKSDITLTATQLGRGKREDD